MRQFSLEGYALYVACRDPRVRWYAKALAICVVGYGFRPIDLIPDPIPVLSHLDDLVLIPLSVVAVRPMIPAVVLAQCRAKADTLANKPRNWVAGAIIIAACVTIAAAGTLCAQILSIPTQQARSTQNPENTFRFVSPMHTLQRKPSFPRHETHPNAE